ncbi:MAG: GNAT family N-acetyltransferase [Bryobacteraceae bacterium]
MTIRKASPSDAAALVAILEGIARERVHTAIDRPWPPDAQRVYIESFSPREAIHVAEAPEGIAAYQILDLWAKPILSMSHVGQIGTYVTLQWRRRGLGEALFERTCAFARGHGYEKFVIQVRSTNVGGLGFYTKLGFRECGRLARQVRIDGVADDEVLLEYFLE